jgi:probable rRNA maturation factor
VAKVSKTAKGRAITVQIATRRKGIPHARVMRIWVLGALSVAKWMSHRETSAVQICIRVIGAAESRRLNRDWRGKDYSTNVLSFPYADEQQFAPSREIKGREVMLGDLAICAPVVAREASIQGKSLNAHWAHMVVHGVLHLLGYDHERVSDSKMMEALEVQVLARWKIANPYQ